MELPAKLMYVQWSCQMSWAYKEASVNSEWAIIFAICVCVFAKEFACYLGKNFAIGFEIRTQLAQRDELI